MDTLNKFMVSVRGEDILVMNLRPSGVLSKAEALNLAAWLVSLADPGGEDFPKWLEAVQNT